VYENGAFVKKTYGLTLNAAVPNIVPDVNSPSREQKGGVWYMGSGYGFTVSWSAPGAQSGSPSTSGYTEVQSAYMFFPEFGYANTASKYRLLDKTGTGTFQFPANPNAKNSARLHFIPLWYPDGSSQCQGFATDFWTPAGMLYGYFNSNAVTISGSALDDWHVRG
jgi:hypothetical protein